MSGLLLARLFYRGLMAIVLGKSAFIRGRGELESGLVLLVASAVLGVGLEGIVAINFKLTSGV